MSFDNQIRIIGGKLKNRRLQVIDLEGLRPTTERARETLFNWLEQKLPNARVLDLFAGSGALGFEALSRGATDVTLVEQDAGNFSVLQAEIDYLYTLPLLRDCKLKVFHNDALNFIRTHPDPYDIIFLDPPYSGDLLEKSVELLIEYNLLADGGLIYAEMASAKKKLLYGLEMVKEAQMGMTHFGLYEKSFFL